MRADVSNLVRARAAPHGTGAGPAQDQHGDRGEDRAADRGEDRRAGGRAARPTYSDAVTRRVPTALIAAVSLVAGFAVAQATGVRALGGAVLVLGAAWCVQRSWRTAGPWRVAVVVVLGALGFVASHVLARTALGAWPSVLLVSAALGAATWLVVDTRGRPSR